MDRSQLVPGVQPPIRLITALQDGVSKRSDVFVADRYLKDLERDFCGDLLKDTTDALRWMEFVNSEFDKDEKRQFKCFTYDFKGLYDSLDQEMVIESLKEAISECRPDWSEDFCNWLILLVQMSLKSSIGVFENVWYVQKGGVPTGGTLCVQLANIAVYSKMRKVVFSDPFLMKDIKSTKRYIDDGAGVFMGTREEFLNWITIVNIRLAQFGLVIDEYCIKPVGEFVPFLDIQFCFNSEGELQTDLFIKPTDSRSYLNFSSCHPNHVFSGIVFSQCIRLRRIINDNVRLTSRINELLICFRNAGYPSKMLENISNKVLNMERNLDRRQDSQSSVRNQQSPIRVVSTFGSDSDITNSVKNFESALFRTRSFSSSDAYISPSPSPAISRMSSPIGPNPSNSPTTADIPVSRRKLFKFIKKTGPSIRSKVVKVKNLATGQRFGETKPCKARNCMCCEMITDQQSFSQNNSVVKSAGGSCSSYNIVYLVICTICQKFYIGRSTRPLKTRIGEHRRNYYRIVEGNQYDTDSDEYCLGAHLYEHGVRNKSDFSQFYRVCILDICSPKVLDVKEHKYIHLLNTLVPSGINISNPFAIPPLHKH